MGNQMISNRPSRLTSLLDRLSGRHLLLTAIAVTFSFAMGYWALSRTSPSNGLIEPESSQTISLADGLYFSVVTEATLGYGDIRPVGVSRFLACSQVLFGLLLAGMAVAKITSLSGRELRLTTQKASGDWIEINQMPDGHVFLTFAMVTFDGALVRYDGENFSSDGNPLGFFKGEMIEVSDTFLRFRYSNRDSNTTFFDEGVACLHFIADPRSGRWNRYHGTAHDFGKLRIVSYEGFRASEEESAIIHGSDFYARQHLVRNTLAGYVNGDGIKNLQIMIAQSA